MDLIANLIQTGNVIKRLHEIKSIDGDAYNQLMQRNEETLAYLHERACAEAERPNERTVLPLRCVIARFLGVLLFIPASMIYFTLFMIANPIQYIFTGNHTIANKYHKFIDNVIKSNGL